MPRITSYSVLIQVHKEVIKCNSFVVGFVLFFFFFGPGGPATKAVVSGCSDFDEIFSKSLPSSLPLIFLATVMYVYQHDCV